MRSILLATTMSLSILPLCAKEFHVSPAGHDSHSGSSALPLKTITAAAQLAQPGDSVIVHAGEYRERINPPRGGISDARRITYRAATGETVVIKGSERVSAWHSLGGGLWKIVLPNAFFGEYNPYRDTIKGDWFNPKGRIHHTGEVYINGHALVEFVSVDRLADGAGQGWYCQSDDQTTSIWVGYAGSDLNTQQVEINVRPTCFYPERPGRDYITIKGFVMRHAATQWAAPTAEQIGMIGTHWSKGWVIEDCIISDSKCVGITLGKDRASGHNDAQSAEGYNVVVRRALANGWSKARIGSHRVRNNIIYNCGAAGICGSMGGAFSELIGNHIYNIHIDKPFTGAEMAGIKLHAPIDVLIKHNYIHDTWRGLWLDWMTQGTRVSANLMHDNHREDLFIEVNHGPYLIDNNVLLSRTSLSDWSQGGAFVHNLFAGEIRRRTERRETPFHEPHSTQIAGLSDIRGGDNRFYGNIFVGGNGLRVYDDATLPCEAQGNLYLQGAFPLEGESAFTSGPNFDGRLNLVKEEDSARLRLALPLLQGDQGSPRVTTKLLGRARIPDTRFENPDGTALAIDRDYFGRARDREYLYPGPFAGVEDGRIDLKVWNKKDDHEN